MYSTLGELEEQDANMHLLVEEMAELWLVHLYQLDTERLDFNVDVNSLGHDRKQSLLIVNASQVPGVVREVCYLGLQEPDGSKLSGAEFQLSFFSVESKVFDVVS